MFLREGYSGCYLLASADSLIYLHENLQYRVYVPLAKITASQRASIDSTNSFKILLRNLFPANPLECMCT